MCICVHVDHFRNYAIWMQKLLKAKRKTFSIFRRKVSMQIGPKTWGNAKQHFIVLFTLPCPTVPFSAAAWDVWCTPLSSEESLYLNLEMLRLDPSLHPIMLSFSSWRTAWVCYTNEVQITWASNVSIPPIVAVMSQYAFFGWKHLQK